MQSLHNSADFSTHIGSCIHTETVIGLLRVIFSLPKDATKGRKGVVVAVYDISSGTLAVKSFGELSSEQYRMHCVSSVLAKVSYILKTGATRSITVGDVGVGAALYGPMIIGFAGLPGKLDEACSLVYALRTSGNMTMDVTQQSVQATLALYSDNEYVKTVFDAFQENMLPSGR